MGEGWLRVLGGFQVGLGWLMDLHGLAGGLGWVQGWLRVVDGGKALGDGKSGTGLGWAKCLVWVAVGQDSFAVRLGLRWILGLRGAGLGRV